MGHETGEIAIRCSILFPPCHSTYRIVCVCVVELESNVEYVEFTIPADFPFHLRRYIPNVHFSPHIAVLDDEGIRYTNLLLIVILGDISLSCICIMTVLLCTLMDNKTTNSNVYLYIFIYVCICFISLGHCELWHLSQTRPFLPIKNYTHLTLL